MSLWAVPSILAIALLGGLLAHVSRRRPPTPLWPTLGFVLASALLYALGDLVAKHLARDLEANWSGLLLLYGGLFTLGPSVFFLAVRFAEAQGMPFRWGRSRRLYALPAVFASLAALFAANPWHGQFISQSLEGRNELHWLWWASSVLVYGVSLLAFALFLRVAQRSFSARARLNALTMAAALALTVAGSLLFVLPSEPPPFDTTTVGLCLSCGLFITGVRRRRLFALSPVALPLALDQESDPLLLLDADLRTLYANAAAKRLFGGATLALGDTPLPALAQRLKELRDPLAPSGNAADLAQDFDGCDGLLHPLRDRALRLRVAPIRSERGERIGCWLRFRDETALQRATRDVQEQTAVREAILASSDEGILVTDLEGRPRYANEAFTGFGNLPRELVEEADAEALLDASLPVLSDPEGFVKRLDEVMADPHTSARDELELRDGRTLERSTRPLLMGGEPAGRVWRLRDVTEQREAERALRQAQKLESLGVLAGGVAHDFNNLLVAILGNAEHALGTLQPDQPERGALEDVVRAAERASDLTRQLLAYAGKGRIVAQEVDLSRVVGETASLLAASVWKDIAIDWQLAEDLPALRADPSQLKQIVTNLVLNAADAIGERPGSVRIATGAGALEPRETADPSSVPCVVLQVSDDGCGMDPETRARIFDPFFTTKFSGRGLGLAALDGIVRSHHGAIRVESEPDRGSCFCVLLPSLSDPARPPPESRERLDCEPALLGSGRVLVVDDEPEVGRVAVRILEGAGFETLRAQNGAEAVDMLSSRVGEIDAVLLDVTMPGLSGPETFAALRRLEPAVPVVWTSGHPEADLAPLEAAPGSASALFVGKPYRAAVLCDAVRRAIDGPPDRSTRPATSSP